jgi:DNA-binding transcriptional LysR family regulator
MHDATEAALDALAPRIRQFAAVARTEHLTQAADILGMPQPTLSRAIARLEADLGVPLFSRPGRAIKLTRHGRALLEASERTLASLRASLEILVDEADPARGRVALAFLHTLGTDVVPRMLRDFREVHPGVRFTLAQDSASAMLDMLRSGEVDLCLTAPQPDVPGVIAYPLDEQRVDLFVPASHRLAAASSIRLAQASGEDFICFTPGHGLRLITDEMFRAAGFSPRTVFEGEQVATIRGLVGAGLGVALLTTAGTPDTDPAVATIRITAPKAARTVCLTWLADRELTAPAIAFRDFVRGYRGRLVRT